MKVTKPISTQAPKRATIRIVASGPYMNRINYSRRMYAIIRRYTPEAVEGNFSECFADLTGLRTFFKMTYSQMVESIVRDLRSEIGTTFTVTALPSAEYDYISRKTKAAKNVSTYKEMNSMFAGKSYVEVSKRKVIRGVSVKKRMRLHVPYLGKVA